MTEGVVAVVGSRSFRDYEKFKSVLDGLKIDKLRTGDCPSGADYFCRRYANEKKIPLEVEYADWKTYGKVAGLMRNGPIVEPAMDVIAFWDGQSPGTKDSIEKAKAMIPKKRISIIRFSIAPAPERKRVWLEFDESDPERLKMIGSATYNFKEDIKKMGGKFDGVEKIWYIQNSDPKQLKIAKEKIIELTGNRKRKSQER